MSEYILIDKEYKDKLNENKSFTIDGIPTTSNEELFILDVYDFIKNKKTITINNKEIIAVSKTFANELQKYVNREDFLNQFRLNLIENIIDKNFNMDIFPNLVKKNKRKETFPITSGINNFFQKYKSLIEDALIQKYIYQFLVWYSNENSLGIDTDRINDLVFDIKKVYSNPFQTESYICPVSDEDIEVCKSNIEKIYDKDDEIDDINRELKNEILEFIYRLISPLSSVKVDYICDMVINNRIYLNYLKKSQMKTQIFNDFFIHQLYIKISNQPKMTFLYKHSERVLFFSNENESINKNFAWRNELIFLSDNNAILDYLECFKNKKIPNIHSSKYKGDIYEMYCQKWLKIQGYNNIKIIGQRGDKGIDNIAINPNEKTVGVQCKYKKNGQISSGDIRLLHLDTIQKYYPHVNETLMISNASISKDAINDLERLNIVYIILPYLLKEPT